MTKPSLENVVYILLEQHMETSDKFNKLINAVCTLISTAQLISINTFFSNILPTVLSKKYNSFHLASPFYCILLSSNFKCLLL